MKMIFNEIDGALTKEELLYVYRKVKRDLYFEKDSILLEKIVVFENKLEENINFLYNLLKSDNGDFDRIISHIDVGSFTYLYKNINFGKDEKQKIISTKTVENYKKKLYKIDNVECRFIGDISIIFQLIGGLWINRIGCKIDETLSNNVYGCRLEKFDSNIHVKNYKQNNTLFKPYFKDFKSWQNNLFKKIEQSDKDVIFPKNKNI